MSDKQPEHNHVNAPTLEQTHLIRAALLEGDQAKSAWQTWHQQIDIEQIDSSSYELLCQLHQNLINHQVSHPLQKRLTSVYKRHWYNNQLWLTQSQSVFQLFQQVGIQTLTIGDFSLAAKFYDQLHHRPINCLDLLLRPKDLQPAIAMLAQLKWQPHQKAYPTGLMLENPAKQRLYLHHHVFWAAPSGYRSQVPWLTSKPFTVETISTSTLSPAEHLLFTAAQLNRYQQPYQIHRLADAAQIVRSCSDTINWPQLLTQARKYRLSLPLRLMLEQLREVLSFDIPQDIITELTNQSVSSFELLRYQVNSQTKLRKIRLLQCRIQHRISYQLHLITSQRT